MEYILNVNSRTVHDANSTDGRCRLNQIRAEHKIICATMEEALNYLPQGKKPTKKCSFCLGSSETD